MPGMFRPQHTCKPYHFCVSKKPKPVPDPDSAQPLSRDDKIIRGFNALIGENIPVMVTSWISFVEYMDADGNQRLAAFSSNLPPWRLTGIIDSGSEMLLEEYDYEED
jgi:hypothetical protein